MNKIGIFFGSDTGNTENVAKIIQEKLKSKNNSVNIFDISESNKQDIEKYNKLIFGVSTWYYGEMQYDWDDFFPTLNEINFSNKAVALFGCGDQEDYTEYFCDAIGIIHNTVKRNGANLVGYWSSIGYFFKKSKGLINPDYFSGLTIDEDRQPELTLTRINKWVDQIKKEMNI